MDLNLQQAVDMTVTRMLDGAGLHGIPGHRTVVIQVEDDREKAHLVCPDHDTVLADLDGNLHVTAEYSCNECDIQECSDCDTWHHRVCSAHTVHDAIPMPWTQRTVMQ